MKFRLCCGTVLPHYTTAYNQERHFCVDQSL